MIMPPALQPQSETVTLAQYEALPKSKRMEVFDGIAYDMVIHFVLCIRMTMHEKHMTNPPPYVKLKASVNQRFSCGAKALKEAFISND